MKITTEEAVRFLSQYDNEHHTPKCREAHRMAIAAIREQDERRWIPVTERLPEYGQEVIVYTGNVLKPIVMECTFWKPEYDTWVHVSHWMPLPGVPEEGEGC